MEDVIDPMRYLINQGLYCSKEVLAGETNRNSKLCDSPVGKSENREEVYLDRPMIEISIKTLWSINLDKFNRIVISLIFIYIVNSRGL